MPSPVSDRAVEAVLAARRPGWEVVLLGVSVPLGNGAGWRRLGRWLRRGGAGVVPYLLANFGGMRGPRAAGVPAVRVADVNGAGFARRLRAAGADLIVSFHFDQIIGAGCLAAVPGGGVNVHPSLLPRHRGPIPAFWALLDAARGEEAAFGVTVHRIAARVDAGAILAQRAVGLPPGLSATGAARALHDAAVGPLLDALDAVAVGAERERTAPVLPYRGFPDAATLRAARGLGVRLLHPADVLSRGAR